MNSSCIRPIGLAVYQQIYDYPKSIAIAVISLGAAVSALSAMHSIASAVATAAIYVIVCLGIVYLSRSENRRDAAAQVLQIPSNPQYIDRFIGFFGQLGAAQRHSLLTQALRLLHPDKTDLSVLDFNVRIVLHLYSIAENQREEFVTQALRLLTPNMSNSSRHFVIQLISQIKPSQERNSRIDRAILQWAQERLQYLGLVRLGRLLELLDTPLQEQFPPLFGNMARLAAGGVRAINVHANQRDQRTRQALAQLRRAQGALPAKAILQQIQSLKDFLDQAVEIEQEMREKAIYALEGPTSLNDFGPLLGDPLCGSYRISGAAAVARHWLYASTYQDPISTASAKEQHNAKLAVISALGNSYTEQGERVCNEGKVQRLVIGVLQGRLAEVNVDEVPLVLLPTVAINVFFAIERHRHLANRAELIDAAALFCREHPQVEQVNFVAEIQRYTTAQGMD